MDLTAKQTLNTTIYVENLYEGNLALSGEKSIESIPWQNWFQTWLESSVAELKVANSYELSLRLTGDRQIETYNSEYRQKNCPTDVLAFAATEVDLPLPLDLNEPLYLGDIIISLDTAARQAQEQKHSLKVELAWLATHGLLHLIGWDHADETSLKQMLSRQAELITLIKIG